MDIPDSEPSQGKSHVHLQSLIMTRRSNVEFYLVDPAMSDKHTTRKMDEGLLPPAATMVKHLGPISSPHEYLVLFDSAYGTLADNPE